MQFEYGNCSANPISDTSSVTANNCGNCSDAQFKAADMHRSNNNFNPAQVQNVFLGQAVEQNTTNVPSHVKYHYFANNLVGTSILII